MLVLFIQLKSRITVAWNLVRPCPPNTFVLVASMKAEMRIAKATASMSIDAHLSGRYISVPEVRDNRGDTKESLGVAGSANAYARDVGNGGDAVGLHDG